MFIGLFDSMMAFDISCISKGTPGREQAFDNRAANLAQFSNRAAKTALMVAAGSSGGNKKLTEALLASSGQVSLNYYFLKFRMTKEALMIL